MAKTKIVFLASKYGVERRFITGEFKGRNPYELTEKFIRAFPKEEFPIELQERKEGRYKDVFYTFFNADNLKLGDNCVETVYQKSKIFDDGKPCRFLETGEISGRDAVYYVREYCGNKRLEKFLYKNHYYPKDNGEFFDYLYINALLGSYFGFTPLWDMIERMYRLPFCDYYYNPEKHYHTAAEALALFVYMVKAGLIKQGDTKVYYRTVVRARKKLK